MTKAVDFYKATHCTFTNDANTDRRPHNKHCDDTETTT